MQPRLTIYRGLPGSGKTTHAKARQARYKRGEVARVNRDDLRRVLFSTEYQPDSAVFEDAITTVQHRTIAALLYRGLCVLCDDTNLHPEHVLNLQTLARNCGAEWEIVDLTDVPLSVCILRDSFRPDSERVGATIIRSMWERCIKDQPYPLPTNAEASVN